MSYSANNSTNVIRLVVRHSEGVNQVKSRRYLTLLLVWVLWEQMELRSPSKELVEDKWNVYVATDTRTECDAALQVAWKVKLEGIRPLAQESGGTIIPTAPGVIIIITKAGSQVSTTFRCLPDTIDPRGPKQ